MMTLTGVTARSPKNWITRAFVVCIAVVGGCSDPAESCDAEPCETSFTAVVVPDRPLAPDLAYEIEIVADGATKTLRCTADLECDNPVGDETLVVVSDKDATSEELILVVTQNTPQGGRGPAALDLRVTIDGTAVADVGFEPDYDSDEAIMLTLGETCEGNCFRYVQETVDIVLP